jgi:acetyl esterase/lipase
MTIPLDASRPGPSPRPRPPAPSRTRSLATSLTLRHAALAALAIGCGAGIDASVRDAGGDDAHPDVHAIDAGRAGMRTTRTLEVDGVRVEAIIERPSVARADALLLYHGTVVEDRLVLGAAEQTLETVRPLLDRDDLLLVSVAYPEEGLLLGDNLVHAEAALLWVQRHAAEALGIEVDRIFLLGHSQGGYLVTQLGTRHAVDGVIANAPGPLDLVFRCGLEESGRLEVGVHCAHLAETYGSTTENPDAYMARSLLAFSSGFRSDILFVQGLDDSPIQMRSWPMFRARVEACADCRSRDVLELEGLGHPALFQSPEAQDVMNAFLAARSGP